MKRPLKALLLALVFLAVLVLDSSLSSPGMTLEINEGEVMPLNDRDYFPVLKSLIDSAGSSVHVMVYDINYYPEYPDSPSNVLISSLANASGRGVDVRVITDETPTEKPVLSILREGGVQIKFDSKEVTTHAKLIIIDSEIVIIGSTNWSYNSLDKNHEANLLAYSPGMAGRFEDYFQGVWAES